MGLVISTSSLLQLLLKLKVLLNSLAFGLDSKKML